MPVSSATPGSSTAAAQHIEGQYKLDAAHHDLSKVNRAARALALEVQAFIITIQRKKGSVDNPAEGSPTHLDNADLLLDSLDAAKTSLKEIASQSRQLDTEVLSLFPQAGRSWKERCEAHLSNEDSHELTKNNQEFPVQARDLIGKVKRFALTQQFEAASALRTIEAAGPAVANRNLMADHRILAQMNNLTHL